jgi:tetratricopeptide (TPR) repeat protein
MKRWLTVTAALMVLAGVNASLARAATVTGLGPAIAQDDPAKKAEAEAYKAWYDARTDSSKGLPLAKAYVEKFPSGMNVAYVKNYISKARGEAFNQAMQAKDVAKMIQLGNEALAEDPNSLDYLYLLAYSIRQDELGANPRSFAHASEAADYSNRAIKLIDEGKVPAVVPKDFKKNSTLNYLYQNLALIEVNKKNNDKALEYYSKGAGLDPSDPQNFLACGSLHQIKYQAALVKFQGIPEADRTAAEPKPEVKAALDDVNREADSVIDCWARFMAVSASNTAYASTRTQVGSALTELYKYRHPDAPDGLQKLIDQYKAQAGTPSAGNTASANTNHI